MQNLKVMKNLVKNFNSNITFNLYRGNVKRRNLPRKNKPFYFFFLFFVGNRILITNQRLAISSWP